jgi:hypothetical protein
VSVRHRRPPLLTRNQRLLLLATLAVAVFWLGAALLSIYAITGAILLGGAALALSLDRPAARPVNDHVDAAALDRAAQAMSASWGPGSWNHADHDRRQQMLDWATAAVDAYTAHTATARTEAAK